MINKYAKLYYKSGNVYYIKILETKTRDTWKNIGIRGYVFYNLNLPSYNHTIQCWFHDYKKIEYMNKEDMMIELL